MRNLKTGTIWFNPGHCDSIPKTGTAPVKPGQLECLLHWYENIKFWKTCWQNLTFLNDRFASFNDYCYSSKHYNNALWYKQHFIHTNFSIFEKQPPRRALRQRCSENIQQVYRTPIPRSMPKSHFGMGAFL